MWIGYSCATCCNFILFDQIVGIYFFYEFIMFPFVNFGLVMFKPHGNELLVTKIVATTHTF